MIITKLKGGLGNQMFQYAIGCNLASKNDTCLRLDVAELLDRTPREGFTFRNFELDVLKAPVDVATQKDLSVFFSNNSLFDRVWKGIRRRLGFVQIIFEQSLEYQPSVLEAGANTYLAGYWQSEKYFVSIREKLMRVFALKNRPNQSNAQTLDKIKNSNAVSFHIRRTDYASSPDTHRTHGVCDLEYYRNAIAFIEMRVHNPVYFVFSDDIPWCKKNLSFLKKLSFIQGNADNPAEDLRLMSNCKHNIIANSSFSWWGAWLNANPNKFVIAPQRWFADREMNKKTKDLIPNAWVQL